MINQIPEPPDDPAPEPPTPADDAVAPCPVCGAPGETTTVGQIRCADDACEFAIVSWMPDTWHRLSRAAALLRAVEAEAALLRTGNEGQQSRYISALAKALDPSILSRIQLGRGLYDDQILMLMTAPAAVRADALIALAAQLEAGDETMA